jgi:ubiquinone/menaquinone biosynthesis C-methylase UbiE
MTEIRHLNTKLRRVVVGTKKTDQYRLPAIPKRRGSLLGDNLAANANVEALLYNCKLQVDALWFQESPLLLNAYRTCVLKRQSINSKIAIRILDTGCGTGEVITRLVGKNGLFQQMVDSTNQLFEVDLVELDEHIYELCRKRLNHLKTEITTPLTVHHASATALPFKSNTFDLILNRHMLHCVPKNKISTVLKEIHRVLKPDGIVHFVVEDMGMIYSSVDDEKTSLEHTQLWSNGVCGTAAQLGVDLRIGRKLPMLLTEHGFITQSLTNALVDTFHVDRQIMGTIFELWHSLYGYVWKQNNIDFKYDDQFKKFIKFVKEEQNYVCWNVPLIQAMKKVASEGN